LGLVQDYKEKNSEIDSWIRSTIGLTFLTPQEVSLCFIEDFVSPLR
ncbi:FLYWCH-type domain-containing protein, partial [Aphis craccivora]